MEIGKPGRPSDVIDLRGKTPAEQAKLNPVGPAAPPPPVVADPWNTGPGPTAATTPTPTSPMVPGSVSPGQMGMVQPAPRMSQRGEDEEDTFQMGNANLNEFNGAAFKVRPTSRTTEVTQGTGMVGI